MKRIMMFSGLLALVAVALAVWLVLDRPQPRSPEEEWKPQPLVDKNAKIQEITIVSDGKTFKFVFRPDYQSFVLLVDGHEYMADNVMLGRLVGNIYKLEKKKLISLDPPDLTIYKLKPSVFSLSVKFFDSPKNLELEVGKQNYSFDSLFAQVKGEPTVFLIPPDIGAYIGLTAKAFRSRVMLYFTPPDVASIEIKITDPDLKSKMSGALEPKLVVQKGVEGEKPRWLIVSPISEEGWFPAVDFLFQILGVSRAQDIFEAKPEELAGFGLNPPRATLTLTMFSGQQQQAMFGGDTVEGTLVYAKNSLTDDVYLLPKSKVDLILSFSGRVESLLNLQRELHPNKVFVEYPREGLPAMELNLLQNGTDYSVAGRPGLTVPLSRLQQITMPLRDNQIFYVRHQEPYPREKFGLDRPRMTVRLVEGDTTPVNLAFGDTTTIKGQVITYVEDLRRKCIVGIPIDILELIPYGEREFTTLPKRQEP